MLNFSINISNPWSTEFKNLGSKSYATPFKHKFIELEHYKISTLLSFSFNWTVRCDHSGLDIELGLFGYCVHFNFYDSRHWNKEAGRWMIYTEEKGLH